MARIATKKGVTIHTITPTPCTLYIFGVVRCGTMGLYSIREFLSFFDLEEFLSDIGVMAVNFYNYEQAYQFSEMLKQLVNSGKLTPVIQVSNELYTIDKYNKPFIDGDPDPTDPTPYETIQEYYTGWAVISKYCFRSLSKYYYYQKREVGCVLWEPYGVSYPENWHAGSETGQYISIYEIYFPKSQIIDIFGDSPFNELIAKLDNANQVIETLKQENDKLQAQIDQQVTATPANYALSAENSSYTTPFIDALNAVIQEFWINYQEHNIPPKQDMVIRWIMEHYNLSRAGAKAIEQVARPAKAKTGGIKSLP